MRLRHVPAGDASAAAAMLAQVCADGSWDGEPVDFVDGTVFSRTESYVTLGRYELDARGQAPSDRTKDSIYYRSVRSERSDLLTMHDYLWRWDTDWFWCSRAFGAQNPWVRRLWPADKLRSDVYWKLIALDRRTGFSTRLDAARRRPPREHVVQDIEVPVDRLADFLDFFHREVGIEPVWLCPLRQRDPSRRWPLYELDPDHDATSTSASGPRSRCRPGVDPPRAEVNRRIEQVVSRARRPQVAVHHGVLRSRRVRPAVRARAYQLLRKRYDPDGRLVDMYDKTVGRR